MKIPGDLKFPTKTDYCALGLNVALFDLQHNQYLLQEIQSTDIKLELGAYLMPARQFEFNSAPGCLCVVSLGLYFYEKTFAGNAILNNKSFSPAAILKAFFTPGAPVKGKSWPKMVYERRKKHKAITKQQKALKTKETE